MAAVTVPVSDAAFWTPGHPPPSAFRGNRRRAVTSALPLRLGMRSRPRKVWGLCPRP